MENIGSQLLEAREARGLSLADVAHETRVSAGQIRALEENDYSEFASLTYARYFLSLYSDFLGVDTDQFQAEFPDAMLGSSDSYAYLQDPTESLRPERKGSENSKANREARRRAPAAAQPRASAAPQRTATEPVAPKSHPILLVGLMALLFGGLFYFFFGDKSAEFVGDAKFSPREVPAILAGNNPGAAPAEATNPETDPEGSAVPAVAPPVTEEPAPKAVALSPEDILGSNGGPTTPSGSGSPGVTPAPSGSPSGETAPESTGNTGFNPSRLRVDG